MPATSSSTRPSGEKVRREREAGGAAAQAAALVETVDRDRAAFIKQHFSLEWPCRSIFHLMVNSQMGDDAVLETILGGMNALDMR